MSCLIGRTRFADKLRVPSCDSCGAPTRIDRDRGLLACEHCGSHQELPPAVEHLELFNETSSLCPICSTHLSASRLEGHPLLACARCFGMLIEMNCFAAVIDAMRAHDQHAFTMALPRRQRPSDRLINCPSCGHPMLGHLYAGPGNVCIDSCERCQVNWLDPGELRRIAVAPDRPLRRTEVD